jgi:hypothetical protein
MARQVPPQGHEAEVIALKIEQLRVGETVLFGAGHTQHALVVVQTDHAAASEDTENLSLSP